MKQSGVQRVVVTGGAGFLGSHLCEALVSRGAHVLCIDNFYTGSRQNIQPLLDSHRFELLCHDVTQRFSVEAHTIYNLACPASPDHYQRDPVYTTKTCVYGAMNMLDIARVKNAVILQASTSEVYGDPEVHPQSEGYYGNVNPIGVRSCYDEGKRCAEALFFDFHRKYKQPIKVARIFNTYGPRMHPNDGRVVSNFVVQALMNRDITIYGEGLQTRSFCYVTDMVDAIVRLMNSPERVTGPVNLGSSVEFTIRELADLIVALTNSRSKIICAAPRADDPRQRQPNTNLCETDLGWRATTPLGTGLERTIEYFDRLLGGRKIAPPDYAAAAQPATAKA